MIMVLIYICIFFINALAFRIFLQRLVIFICYDCLFFPPNIMFLSTTTITPIMIILCPCLVKKLCHSINIFEQVQHSNLYILYSLLINNFVLFKIINPNYILPEYIIHQILILYLKQIKKCLKYIIQWWILNEILLYMIS